MSGNSDVEAHSDTGNTAHHELPGLRVHDQTPVARTGSKGMCSEPSPINEYNDNIIKSVNDAIEKSMDAQLPKLLESVETRIMDTLKQLVDDAMMVRGEVMQVMTQKLQVERRYYLKSISEAELLEAYNRRDNI